MNTCLSIAGSDPSGGAGIQADLKTMTVNGVYAMCAITALTVQNTLGVTNILEVEPAFLGQQIDAVFQDIRPDAVKVGMVSSAGLIRVIAQKLRQHGAQNVVVDPVMVATSGSRLLESDAATALREELFPLATVVTPNIPEAQALSGWEIFAPVDMERAAQAAPCPAPSPRTWPRAKTWKPPWQRPRSTSPGPWLPCWTWATAAAPWTTPIH